MRNNKRLEIDLDLQIDENNLESEWIDQPRRYFEYGAKLAGARRDLDGARAALDVTKAELDRDVRLDPGRFGLTKLTETVVSSTVVLQQGCKDAVAAVAAAKHKVDVLGAAVGALDHRRKALENLVSLFLSNYYAKPKAPEGAKERMATVEQRAAWRRGKGRREERKRGV